MSIKHKANLGQHLSQLDTLMAKYPLPQQPSTPDFTHNRQFQNLDLQSTMKSHHNSNMTGLKERNIKDLDEKINSIMKKHQSNNEKNNYQTEFDFGLRHKIGNNQKQNSPTIARKYLLQQYEDNTKNFNSTLKTTLSETSTNLEIQNKIDRSCLLKKEATPKTSQSLNTEKQRSRFKENNYDSQIEKLNQRIKQAEEKKKQCNIQFSPFSCDKNKNKKISFDSLLMEKLKNVNQADIQFNNRRPLKESKNICISQSKGKIKKQKDRSIDDSYTSKIEKYASISNQFFSTNKNTNSPVAETVNIKQKTFNKQSNSATSQIVDAFVFQIKLDQDFRNLKIWFTFSTQPDKWEQLQKELQKHHKKISKIKQTFESSIEEHNPFYRWEGTNFSQGINALVISYCLSQQHWEQVVGHKWILSKGEQQHLKNSLIYNNRASSFTLQDFVRFINIEKDTFYRNRDLFLIFKRISGSTQQANFKDLISFLAP